eukprot:TRINITY_DN649_c0_g1_i3.p1 TRINITY_DN649_c0_g1~~TRINITY_DN649_c0_g1_i3.p1  ORF type:complete len:350 (+),score=107.06 TRINITY_DN649_c0_g1_i3:361-1410(+)
MFQPVLIETTFRWRDNRPPLGRSTLLISTMKHAGCYLYITSDSNFGLLCLDQLSDDTFARCQTSSLRQSDKLTNQTRPFSLFDLDQRDSLFTVSLLLDPRSRGTSYVYLNGSEVLACEMETSFKFDLEYVQLFDDDAQWRFLAAQVDVYGAFFYRAWDVQPLVRQANKAQAVTAVVYQADAAPSVTTRWFDCESTRNETRGLTESMKCRVEIKSQSGSLSAGSLSLGCSRPDCTVQIVSGGNVEKGEWPIVEYRPNYPDNFVSEDVGGNRKLKDKGFLTDGFSFFNFSTDMTFTSQVLPDESMLETGAEETMQAETNAETGVGDIRRYMCVDSKPRIQPIVSYYSEDVF